MSGQISLVASWMAVGLTAVAAVSGVGALLARSVFVMFAQLVVCAAAAAGALLLLQAGDGALALVLFGAGWAPLLLLAAMLLSARAAKRAVRQPWTSLAAAAITAGAAVWGARDMAAQATPANASAPDVAFWIAPLVIVSAIAVTALLGFGERGAFGGVEQQP